MKVCKLKFAGFVFLAIIFIATLFAGIASVPVFAATDVYNESYRNRLTFSASNGWNNDPNGLLYVDGTYHMYYQYNYDKTTGATANGWGHMSWGHAISTDLVHWDEQPVALPEGTVGDDGNNYGMMFSGSAVYDENNTSGLFDMENGKVADGQGIVAILTQPDEAVGGQRQILAYSKDNGQSFAVYGEIISAKDDGGLGDGEFRDPKVFWNDSLNKWLMAVGGGSVRMYASDNLKNWAFLGQTGYWGECPDISRFEVEGEEKYVLIISPEDKAKSHEYNHTNRADTYFPAEYYVVGDLNENGLFVSNDKIKRLSEGIDCYAFQSFNNTPDGKVYGVSWAASWKSVGEYEKYRKNYNGGMTVVCELDLIKENGEFILTRKPVEGYNDLRKETVKEYSGELTAGNNALAGVRADVAEVNAELDFTGSSATYAELNLRVSAAEKISLRYNVASSTLTLDRSNSSLLAKDTALYAVPYSKVIPLKEGKLTLNIILDRANISVFVNGGRASFFSSVFPSAISNAMQLTSDGDINVNAKVYSLNSIFNVDDSIDELILTTDKINANVGSAYAVIASSYSKNFNTENVLFKAIDGSDKIKLNYINGTAFVTALKSGFAKIEVSYGSEQRYIELFIYNDGFSSTVDYNLRLGGYSYIADDGLRFETGVADAFLFSNTEGKNFIYSAEFTPTETGAQAAGLVFGVSGNLTDYLVATVDIKDNKVKLWRSGIGDLKAVNYDFANLSSVKLTVSVYNDEAKIFIANNKNASIVYTVNSYSGGKVGLNVYNAKMTVNNVLFKNIVAGDNQAELGGYSVIKVVNVTDGSYRLKSDEYTLENGKLTIDKDYLSTLEADTEYVFRVFTSLTDYDVTINTDFISSTVSPVKEGYDRSEALILNVSGGVDVYRVEIDGKQCEFSRDGAIITVAAGNLVNLASGVHTVKTYTDKGRPQAEFSIVTENDYRSDDIEAVSYTFLYIDIAIFATAGITFAVISIILKRKSK